jgi:hypothetical protein
LRFLYFRIHLYGNDPPRTEEEGEEGVKKVDKDEKKEENTMNVRENNFNIPGSSHILFIEK